MTIPPYWASLRAKLFDDLAGSQIYKIREGASGENWYALLDAGQLPRTYYAELKKKIPQHICLFSLTKEHNIAEYGPILIPIDRKLDNTTVAALVRAMRFGWTVSWLSSLLSLNQLAIHLAGHLNGSFTDGSEVLIRYYDPRLLPAFINECELLSTRSLMYPICHWLSWNREMSLVVYDGGHGEKSPGVNVTNISKEVRLAMSVATFDDFVHAQILNDAGGDDFFNWLPHMVNYAVATQVKKARSYGLVLLPDIQLYVSLALTVHPQFFDLIPFFSKNLDYLKRNQVDIATLALAVDDRDWEKLGASGKAEIEKIKIATGEKICRKKVKD